MAEDYDDDNSDASSVDIEGVSDEALQKYHDHLNVDQAKRQQQIIDFMRDKGLSEAQIKAQKQRFGLIDKVSQHEVLTIKYENLGVYQWLQDHPLIWQFGNDGDGVRLLLGLDYDRVDRNIKNEDRAWMVGPSKDKQDLFFRLQQIEIGAKASFDREIYRLRKKWELERKQGI